MSSQWVCFSLGKEKYAHAIESIGEILRYSEPAPIPNAPPEVEGVLNVRGNIVTVLSGRALLGLSGNPSRHILTLTSSCAISVDQVEEIISLDSNEIDKEPNSVSNASIKGTARHRHTLLILIDFLPYCQSESGSEEN